jgi:hypothetical protein
MMVQWVSMPTRSFCTARLDAEALAELELVFATIAEEYAERGEALPADTTAIVHA